VADITITPVVNAGALTPVPAESAALSSTQEQVQTLLASLPSGTLLQGFVLNRDASGNPILRTDQGDFSLQSPFFLKIGSDVVVRVSGSGAQAQASIVTVDGLPPEQAALLPAHAEVADVIGTQTPTAPSGNASVQAAVSAPVQESPAQLPVLEGTVVRALASLPQGMAASATNQAGNASLLSNAPPAAGTQLRLQLVSITPATNVPTTPAAVAGQPSTSQGTSATATTQALPSSPAPATGAQPAAQAAQYSAYLTVPAAEAQAVAAATPAETQAAQAQQTPVLTATLLHTLPTGEAVLATPLGDVQVMLPAALPEGSQVNVRVLGALPQVAQAQVAAPATPAAVLPALAQSWDSLGEIVTQLTQLNDVAAQEFVNTSLPNAVQNTLTSAGNAPETSGGKPLLQNLVQAMANFSAAVVKDDFRGWLGQKNVNLLESAGHGTLIARAEGEFSALRQAFLMPQERGWQPFFLPMMTDEGVRTARFYTRRDKREKQEQRSRATKTDTRFVVETELSALGPLQLDGLFKPREGAAQFDLIVRSHTPFAEEDKNAIRALYEQANQAAGYTGMLMFQETPEFPVHPLEEILGTQNEGVVA